MNISMAFSVTFQCFNMLFWVILQYTNIIFMAIFQYKCALRGPIVHCKALPSMQGSRTFLPGNFHRQLDGTIQHIIPAIFFLTADLMEILHGSPCW